MAKRLLFVCSQPFFEWRGSPIRVGFNLRALVALGLKVRFLTTPHGNEVPVEGVDIVRCPKLPGVNSLPIGPSIPKLIYDVFHLFEGLKGKMSSVSFDAVHAVEDSGIPGLILSKVFAVPLVFEKHSDPGSHRGKGFALRNWILSAYQWVESLVIMQADVVIGTGDELVNQAKEVRPSVRAYSIPDIPSSLQSAEPEEIMRIRAKITSSDDEVLASYVGSFAIYQGIELMFDALPQALHEVPKLKVVIIGGSSEEIGIRRAQFEGKGLDDRVVFLGKVDPESLPAYLAASDILISPRISGRNSPLKVLDYLKAGRCIVATDVEANRQILSESTAVLCAPNPDALATALIRVARDAELRRNIARGASDLLNTRYHYGYFKDQLRGVYTGLGLLRNGVPPMQI